MPEALEYRNISTFPSVHADAINCLAFSSHSGEYLASGGSDGRLVIWRCATGKPLHTLLTHSAVVSLAWISNPARILLGTAAGVLITVKFDDVSSIWALR